MPGKEEVALFLLYDSENRFLLQHRTKDAERAPDYWALFGGGIEEGETPEMAVKRESFEEIQFSLKSPKLILKEEFYINGEEIQLYIYIERFNQEKSVLKLHEGQIGRAHV